MNYYERHLGDYARDTAHLSILEHGVYTLLLDRYYATEQPIPEDQAHRVARARSKDEKAAVDRVLAEFFQLVEEENVRGYRNTRADLEIERARVRIAAAQENGRRGGRPRKNPLGSDQKPTGFVLGSENKTQQKAHQTPDTRYQLEPTESLSGGTRAHARTPTREAADTVGQFEGHDQPASTPSPAAPFAIALNRLGVRCTPLNPDLVAYASEGGTVEHITAIAQHPECQGKPVAYIARFARRELAQPAAEITTTQPARITARTTDNAPSKRMQGLQALEEMKHGTVVPERNPDRSAEAVHALAGPNAKR